MAARAARVKAPPRAYLFWGQEESRKRAALDALIASLVPPEDRDLDVQYFDAALPGLTAETLLDAARDQPMFSGRRVVVVLSAGRLRAPRYQRTQEALAAGIPHLPDSATLVLYANAEDADERRGRLPVGEKLAAAVRAAGEVRQFPLLKPDELARAASEEAASAGKRLLPAAASMLAQRAGPDTLPVLQETRKLIAYVGDRATISPADVELMVAAPPDDNVFRLLDAALGGNRSLALQRLADLRAAGVAPPRVLAMLGRSLRLVAQAKLLQEHGFSAAANPDSLPEELLALLPEDGLVYRQVKSDYGRNQTWQQARGFTWPRLQHAFALLATADAGTKGWERGIEDPELALEVLVATLCDTVRGSRAAA